MNENETKRNILKKVNKKMKWKALRITLITVLCCTLIAGFGYYIYFVKVTPLSEEAFSDINVYKKGQTINEISNEYLEYNTLNFTVNQITFYSHDTSQYYMEKNDDGTASIYFYVGETLNGKKKNKNFNNEVITTIRNEMKINETMREYYEGKNLEEMFSDAENSEMLVSPRYFKTDLETALLDVSKVYYLYYDYKNLNKDKFEKAKEKATLLWEKETNQNESTNFLSDAELDTVKIVNDLKSKMEKPESLNIADIWYHKFEHMDNIEYWMISLQADCNSNRPIIYYAYYTMKDGKPILIETIKGLQYNDVKYTEKEYCSFEQNKPSIKTEFSFNEALRELIVNGTKHNPQKILTNLDKTK